MEGHVVVITGASGFLGRAVLRAVASREQFLPVAVTRRECKFPETVRVQRVSDYSQTQLPDGASLVHLAETAALDRIDAAVERDARQTLGSLLERLRGFCVYASSVAVYGDRSDKAHGSDAGLAGESAYAVLKQGNEKLVLDNGGAVLRFSNLYGPDQASGTVIGDILSQLGETHPMRLSNLAAIRDFLWVEDAAAAVLAALEKKAVGIFNVASGTSYSIGEIADMALRIARQSGRRVEQTAPAPAPSQVDVDISETTRRLGWRPLTSVESGLGRLVAHQGAIVP